MHIVIQYDASATGAPAGFQTAVNEAVAYLDRLVANDITFTIQFGWGTSGPVNANQPGDAAVSEPAVDDVFQPTASNVMPVENALEAAYATNGLAAQVTPGVLANDFATSSSFTFLQLALPQAMALNVSGLDPGDTPIGYVALNSTESWNFDTTGGSNPDFIDAVSALLHEITHDMGRVAGFTSGMQTVESIFDFFRYTADGQLDVTPGGGFFSLNGSQILYPFLPADSDPADWTLAIPQDANGAAPFGAAYNYSAVDMLELKALGFQLNVEPNSYLGDAQSEQIIENSAGAVVLADLANDAFAYTAVGALGSEWKFETSGDFLNDGVSDSLIQNAAGAVVVAEDAGGSESYTAVGALGPEWKFHGAGDFFGDQNTEFLIENTAGAVVLGTVINAQAAYAQVAALGPEWKFEGVGSFLGDGKAEFLIENSAGAVVVGSVGLDEATTYAQVSGLGPEWRVRAASVTSSATAKIDFLIEYPAGAVFAGRNRERSSDLSLRADRARPLSGSSWASATTSRRATTSS